MHQLTKRRTNLDILTRVTRVLLCLGMLTFQPVTFAAAPGYFQITVTDSATGRGVPLVELRTVEAVRYYTDSNGIVAINDPELMGHKVYFSISSPGYTYPTDSFGNSGTALTVKAGTEAAIKLNRVNIAERLYRITGAGIYRDSTLVGRPAPINHPLIDGLVVGQDTVESTIYNGKVYWFFGDTDRPSYPLGQYGTSGATSLLPQSGGLDPASGVDLTYWVDADGFSRPMIPIAASPGPVWVGGLFTMTDSAKVHLFTHYAEINSANQKQTQSGLAEFDDSKALFEPVCTYSQGNPLHAEGHPFYVTENGKTYIYFQTEGTGPFPLIRNTPLLKNVESPSTYEAFTCLAPGTKYTGVDSQLERNANHDLVWAWKSNTSPIGDKELDDLVKASKIEKSEIPTQIRDIDTDNPVSAASGTVYWNNYEKKWIMIATQVFGSPSFLGEVWFAEADTPVGPWLYARKVATHNRYTFYNPTQHPFFDQDNGRLVYFEGTYTDTYSGVTDITPRYNYNQLMYRLALDDNRLALPTPVYMLKNAAGVNLYRSSVALTSDQDRQAMTSIPFYAVAPNHAYKGLVPIYQSGDGSLSATNPQPGAAPVFFGLAAPSNSPSPSVVPLYETKNALNIKTYVAGNTPLPQGTTRFSVPVCWIWRNPLVNTLLSPDFSAASIAAPN